MSPETFKKQIFFRRNYLINKGLQWRFIAVFSLAVLVGFIVNMALVYFLIDRELSAELYKIHIKIRTTSEIAAPVIFKLGAVTIPAILLVSAAAGYFLIRRIELPLLLFRQAIKKTSEGDFTNTFSNDMQSELPGILNDMSGSLGSRFKSLKQSVNGLEEQLSSLERPGLKGPDLKEALDAFSGARQEALRRVSGFKV